MKNKKVLYYVEGEDEEKVVNVLKSKLELIVPGRVQTFNVVDQKISDVRLRTISKDTIVVLVFDTDTGSSTILESNIEKLRTCPSVLEVITIPQVPNLEMELVRSCDIKRITELLNSKSREDFKTDIKRVSNLDQKLKQHNFDIDLFWEGKPDAPYQKIKNLSGKVKLKKRKQN